jgi:hypothetical protein
MWASVIIMANPLAQSGSQMVLAERNHEVQTLPSHGTDQSLAIGIGLWRSDRCSHNLEAHVLNGLIDLRREDAVTVMDQEPIRVIAWDRFTELLGRPLPCWIVL